MCARAPNQYASSRAHTMLRVPLLAVLLLHAIPAYVSERSLTDRLGTIYEKLEKFTVPPALPTGRPLALSLQEKLYAKLDRLNALSPDNVDVSDDDERLISVLQLWGLNDEQLDAVLKDLQTMKYDDDEKESEYGDGEWNDEDLPDYAMDAKDWDANDEVESSTSKPLHVSPLDLTRIKGFKKITVSAVDPIAATNERPSILYESSLTSQGRSQLREEALSNLKRTMNMSKCKVPQPRWLMVKQLAPAADTHYMPPCVELHRCATDTCCCFDETQICAPIEGRYVAIPLLLQKADGKNSVAKMQFFNHTKCECVSRETLQSTVTSRMEDIVETRRDLSSEGQNDWRMPTEEPKLDEEATAPPQLQRCTCPVHFQASKGLGGRCSCSCQWGEASRRRGCHSLARGREHFSLRDRVCLASGTCAPPDCEFGAYDAAAGRCPARARKLRYHARGHLVDKGPL